MTGVRIVSCRSADFNLFQMTYKYISVSSEDFGSLKFPWKKVQHSESGWYAHDLRYMFVVTSSSPPWGLINFFLKMTTRGEISLRDIAHRVTFFQSLACFIFLKRFLLRTLDVNLAKLCNYVLKICIPYYPSHPSRTFRILRVEILDSSRSFHYTTK